MQLANIKISNISSFPYQPDLSNIEGMKFYNKKDNDVNILIGPNGAGKSGFLHILKQILDIGITDEYAYDKKLVLLQGKTNHVIQTNVQSMEGLHKHFRYPDKDSRVLVEFILTEHDYANMEYIVDHRDLLDGIIHKYSTLDIQYPVRSHEQIGNIPSSLILECFFDFDAKKIIIDEKQLSHQAQFVLLYLRTIKLVQICIDMYNEFEKQDNNHPMIPLKNDIAFLGTDKSLKDIPNTINPHAWDEFIGTKKISGYHSSIGFYLCAKKIRNIISDHFTLKMTKKDITDYPQKLDQSAFYTSLVFIIKKYFNKTLTVEYTYNLLHFLLIDEFGQSITFAELSDGEQSLLAVVFALYGYDLNHGMIFIDEPEIHFHPQMQRNFSTMIEKINQHIGTQFIISTYSPLFINEFNIGNVYRFSKINGETYIKNPFLSLSADEATLVHLLKFENMSKIFFVNKIILVEGETDEYFFEFYLKYLHTLPGWKNRINDYEIININGKGSYKVWNMFLSRFGLKSFFIGDRDNIVDYGFMTQDDLGYYYKQARTHYAGLKKSGKTHRHYNKLVDTIRNVFPQKYRYLVANIDTLYKDNVFILKKGDIETYLGMSEKGLENTVKFCHHEFKQRLVNKNFDTCRQEFGEIFATMFTSQGKIV